MGIRDDFTQKTKEIMAKRVGCRCCNPECRILTCGPAFLGEGYVNIGVAAHIAAAAPGGKRYQAAMTKQERSSINNGLWLCQNCAKMIDSDEQKYTVELLKDWKQHAELEAQREMSVAHTFPLHGVDLKIKQKKFADEYIYGNHNHHLEDLFVEYAVSGIIQGKNVFYENVIDAINFVMDSTSEKLLLVLGDYGVGKSSTLKMLASKFNNGRFLYISLKDVLIFSANIRDGIVEFCDRMYQIKLDYSSLGSDLFILLDGFDELQRFKSDEEEDIKLFNQIYSLLQYPKIKIILSSRGTAFLNMRSLCEYSQIHLHDFTDKQIECWIEKWKRMNSQKTVSISLDGLKQRNLLEISRNKLILYMVARIYDDELKTTRKYTKAYIYKCFYDWTIEGKFMEDEAYRFDHYSGSERYDSATYRRILQNIALVITEGSTNELISVDILEKRLCNFQEKEVVDVTFELSKYLFTRHFFSQRYERKELYIEFAHKSLREYLFAEKLFDFIKKESQNESDLGEWFQFGRNNRLSTESFTFLEELLLECSTEELENIIIKTYPMAITLLVANGKYGRYIKENRLMIHEDKAVFNVCESFHRSLVLSVTAAIINNISYNIWIERKNVTEENRIKIQKIDCESVYKICDYYMADYSKMYQVFLSFVSYVQISRKSLSYIYYKNTDIKRFEILDTQINGGIIDFVSIYETNIQQVHFTCVRCNELFIANGKIESSNFEAVRFEKVRFVNIYFMNVHFELLDESEVLFENCVFVNVKIKYYIQTDAEGNQNIRTNQVWNSSKEDKT